MYKVTDKKDKSLATDALLHPGEVLADELSAREITQKDFAQSVNLQPPHLNDLLKGKRHISARIALKIENELGIDAAYWLRLQMNYDLEVAKKEMKLEEV